MTLQESWIAETLAELARRGESIRETNDFAPNSTSQFAEESVALPDAQDSWADRPIALAVRAGTAHLMFAESHLRALAANFQVGLQDDPPVRAASRQILEASAYAHWLLDPIIDERERARRGLEEARYAIEDRSKSIHKNFLDSGHTEIGDWSGDSLLQAIEATKARLNFDILETRPKAAVALDSILPPLAVVPWQVAYAADG